MLLGWDIYNKKGYSEQYREVVREDRIEIKGKVKAPDYSFRIGGMRKFFVEAKKPSVNIKHDIEPAFQLRRYAYTAKLPLSILTDFEEFAVYDTRIKPDKHDQASTARIFYCTYEEYEKEFDFIFNTFSRQAILKGSFDQYIEDTKRKKGTSEVDKEFLKFIEKWRENLAKNIALRNKDLTIYELNYAVQKIIDRIIFLRIAEDRHVEDYGKIQKLLENKKTIYPQLVNLFLQADVKYNSGLFNFKADQVTPELKIDDKILKDIIKSIYYPDSPYEFSVFDVEILGNIYEQFLGKTIRLTASHQAKIENKPEVKKAGGVYYTPKYIVDYIVKNTVGEKIKNKTPDQISNLKILDPACGSGSFLLGAYQMLMNYHLEYYTKDKNIKKSLKENKIYQIKENECRLTIEEKHRILLNNIFGVDIDSQAVEVTKLSLLLKLMEGESQESAGMLFKFSDIKMLPDLSENIKCGNSLIGSDFYDSGQMNLFQDEETTRRINVFDWNKEFPDIFKSGGFDVVIGNPPYINVENLEERIRIHLMRSYETAIKRFDIYITFLEKGIQLLKNEGFISYIIPYPFLNQNYAEMLRKKILSSCRIETIVDFSDQKIFENATVRNCIIVLEKQNIQEKIDKNIINIVHPIDTKTLQKIEESKSWNLKQKIFETLPKHMFRLELSRVKIDIIEKIQRKAVKIGELCYVNWGARSGNIKKYVTDVPIDTDSKKMINARNIDQYSLLFDNKYLWYKKKELYNPMFEELFENEKLIIKDISGKNPLKATFDNEKYYTEHTVSLCQLKYQLKEVKRKGLYFSKEDIEKSKKYSLKYILGFMNAKVTSEYFHWLLGGGLHVYPDDVKNLPVRTIDFNNAKEKAMHDKMVKMVDQMLEVQKKYHNVKTENEKTIYKKQIDILDNQIDKLVYELYELTDEEIEIIEGEKNK